jgi:hypothetical protein
VKLSSSLEPRAETQAVCFKGSATYFFGGYTEKVMGRSIYYNDGVRIKHHKDGTTTWTGRGTVIVPTHNTFLCICTVSTS